MPTPPTTPGLILGGGSVTESAEQSNPGGLEQIYQNLLSGAADIVSGTGVKTLVMQSGAIGRAGYWQVGSTETSQEVANNAAILAKIATFCVQNNIKVQVDADLTGSTTLVDNTVGGIDIWATAAAAANLPIASVEDVEEVGIQSSNVGYFSTYATHAVEAIKEIIQDYTASSYGLTAANLAVGDMEPGGDSTVTSEWWSAYDAAAGTTVGQLSFVTADTGWFGPYIDVLSIPTWQGNLEALSTLAASDHMSLNVAIEGAKADTSGSQYIKQSEQNAVDLATLQASGSVTVGNILVESWDQLPVGENAIDSPTSLTNEAAEVSAVYPLFLKGSITAQGSFAVTAPGQFILDTGTTTALSPLSVQWNTTDSTAGNRLGVVIIDQTGTLIATQHGAGTESNEASNILILSGNSADLAAELSSVTLKEPNAGPDIIDIETFGTAGQLTDNQISVLAAAPGQAVGTISATSNLQGWVSSSSFLNSGTVITGGAVMTSETLVWNTTGTIPAGSTLSGTTDPGAFVKIDTLHEPLAEYGVANVAGSVIAAAYSAQAADFTSETVVSGGTLTLSPTATIVADIYNSSVDDSPDAQGGYANNPGVNDVPLNTGLGPIGWLISPYEFDPAASLSSLIVQSTTNTFDPGTGQLEVSMDSLAPESQTVLYSNSQSGTATTDGFATAFDTGGTQTTYYNTGNNPSWQAGWSNQFATATVTTDDAGQVVEVFLQGGTSDPWFTIDDVFNPNVPNQLWEQFQSTSPPPIASGTTVYTGTSDPYQPGFDTGPLYVTEFDTGNNPNWDYVDWGNAAASDTEVWVDNFIDENYPGFAVNFPTTVGGDVNYYPYEFTNGATLDLMYLPGSIVVNLNTLGTVEIASQTLPSGLSGLTAVDAAGSTGTVILTGLTAGGSTLIGGGSATTIDVSGSGNIATLINGGTIVETGTNAAATLTGTGATAFLNYNGDTITVAGTNDTVNINGSADVLYASNITFNTESSATSVAVTGTNDVVHAASGSAIDLGSGTESLDVVGNGAIVIATSSATSIQALSNGQTVTAVSGDQVGVYGTGEIVIANSITLNTASSTNSVTLNGNNNLIAMATGSTLAVAGTNEAVYASDGTISATSSAASLAVLGNSDTVTAATGDSINLFGTSELINGTNLTITATSTVVTNGYVVGNGDTVTAVSGDQIGFYGSADVLYASNITFTTGNSTTSVTMYGTNDVVGAASGSTIDLGSGTESLDVYGNNAIVVATSSASSIQAIGSGETVTAVSGDQVGVYSTGEIVNAAGITLNTANSTTSVTLSGNNNLVGMASGSTLAVAGTNETVYATDAIINTTTNTTLIVLGNGNTVTASGGNTISLNGTGDIVNNDVSGTTVYLDANASATVNGSGGLITVTGTNIAAIASGQTVDTVANTAFTLNLNGGSDTVNLGTGTDFGIVGSSGGIGFITGTDDNTVVANVGSQTVTGFNMAHGDQIDLRQILNGDSLTSNLSNLGSYVTVTGSGSNTALAISGAGGSDTVVLSGAGAMTLTTLINGNAFALPPH